MTTNQHTNKKTTEISEDLPRRKPILYLIAALLIMIQFVAGFDAALRNSQTYDEAVHLAAGYSYYKTGDFSMNGLDHPPLAKLIAAAPLVLFLKPDFLPSSHPWRANMQGNQYRIGDYFLYKNKIPAQRLLLAGRMAMLVLSAVFSVAFFLIIKRLYDGETAIVSLALWVFCPPIMANSFLVTTDFAATAFNFLTFYFLQGAFNTESSSRKTITSLLLSGLMCGLALASKFSNILIFPTVVVICGIIYILKKDKLTGLAAKIVLFFVVALVVLWFSYSGGNLRIYFDGVEKIFTTAAGEKPRPAYLLGERSIGGWRYYFLATLLIKTPLAIIISLIIFIITAFRKTETLTELKRDFIFFGVPSVILLVVASFSKIQIGHRHILPVYPLIVMWAGAGAVNLFSRRQISSLLVASLIFVAPTAIEFYTLHPWHLSYISSVLPGGSRAGEKYLLDSNFDWGQGLGDLSLFLKSKDVESIYFSYFGSADPEYYGIKFYPIGFISNIERRKSEDFDIQSQKHKYLAISATNLYGVYYADTDVFSYFKKLQPFYRAGNSIFVYDLENPKDAAQSLSEILSRYLSDEEEATKVRGIQRNISKKQSH